MAYSILLVDDSSLVRKVLKKALGMSEVPVDNVYEAGNGAEALDVLHAETVDVVLLDINMPTMDGIDFMRHVNASEQLKKIPVVVISTEGSTERRAELDQLGIRAYLRKPVTPEALKDTVMRILEQ